MPSNKGEFMKKSAQRMELTSDQKRDLDKGVAWDF